MLDLFNCPFCNQNAVAEKFNEDPVVWAVHCVGGCDPETTKCSDTLNGAMFLWNQRLGCK